MTHAATPHPASSGLRALLSGIGAAAAAAFARAERSPHRRLGFHCLNAETLRDIAIAAEEATGLPSQDPGLPFFMQPGFDRR